MNHRVIPWTIEIDALMTRLRVGMLDHERHPQPIRIDISIRAITLASPQSIADCMNYQPICQWIVEEWPKQPHTPLLETKLRELMRFIFDFDSRIEWVDVAMSKPKAIADASNVEIRMAESRQDYEENAPLDSYSVSESTLSN